MYDCLCACSAHVLIHLQTDIAFDSYTERLFVPDVATAPKLHSSLDNNQFLDTISAPSSNKGAKRKTTSRRGADDLVEISDESDEEEAGPGHQSRE